MLQARIPPGTHKIELHYWPDSFNLGLLIALCTVVVLVAAPVVGYVRRRSDRGAATVDLH